MSNKNLIKDPAAPKTVVDKAKSILENRQHAYRQTFLFEKNVYAQQVLEDLARFCRANETNFHPDGRVHAVLEGRREVYLRIKNHLDLDAESLAKMFLKKGVI